MAVLLFLLIGLCVTLIWTGYRKSAIGMSFIVMALIAVWFFHHASSSLTIQL